MAGSVGVKEVTPERFYEVLEPFKDHRYQLLVAGWQVVILHGLIALAADHPGIKKMGEPTRMVVQRMRQWAKGIMLQWGLTPEEVEWLDKARELAGDAPPEVGK